MCLGFYRTVSHCNNRVCNKWGEVLAKRGWLIFLICAIIMVLLSIGVINNSNYDDQSRANTALNGQARDDLDTFNAMAIPDFESMGFIYRATDGSNVMTISHFQQVLDFHEFLMSYNNNQLRDRDCFKKGRCMYSSHLADIFQNSAGVVTFPGAITTDAQLVATVNAGANAQTGTVSVGNIFGDTTPAQITKDFSTGQYNYQEAKAIRCGYFLFPNQTFSEIFNEAKEAFISQNSITNAEFSIISNNLFADQVREAILYDFLYMISGLVVVIAYSMLCLGTCNPIGCRNTVALIGMACSILATLTSYTICSLATLHTTVYHIVIFIFVFLLNLNNMHSFTAIIDSLNMYTPFQTYMQAVMKVSGHSVFLSAISSLSAIIISVFGQIEGVRSFLVYAGVALLFNFFYTVTVYAAYQSMDMGRQLKKKGDWCGACKCKPEHCFFCCGKIKNIEAKYEDRQFEEINASTKVQEQRNNRLQIPDNEDPQQHTKHESAIKVVPGSKVSNELQPLPQVNYSSDFELRGSLVQVWFHLHYSRFINHIITKILVLILFSGLTAFAVYASTQVELDIKAKYFVREDSESRKYFEAQETSFPDLGSTAAIFTQEDGDIRSVTEQLKLYNLNRVLSGQDACAACSETWTVSGTVSSWYDNFLAFVNAGACNLLCNPNSCKTGVVVSETYFPACFKAFLGTSGAVLDGTVVISSNDGSTITAIHNTLGFATLRNPKDKKIVNKMMKEMRQLMTDVGPTGSFIYSSAFLTQESFNIIEDQASMVLVFPLIGIFVLCFLFSGSLCSSILILLIAALIQVNLFGILWYADVKLNYISLSILIIAYGFTVHYAILLTKGYDISQALATNPTNMRRRNQKVKMGLTRFASAIIHGATSSFLLVISMAGSESYVMSTFFRIWLGVVIFAVLHSLILLPVLLSFFGLVQPGDKTKQ